MAKTQNKATSSFKPKSKKKLGRHTKHKNKHKSWKPNVSQG